MSAYGFLVPATAFILLGLVALGHAGRRIALPRPAWPARHRAAFVTQFSSRPTSRTSGRSTSISRSSRGRVRPGAPALWALACGHHDRVRRCCGRSPACNAAVDGRAHAFHVIADSFLAVIARGVRSCSALGAGRRDRTDFVRPPPSAYLLGATLIVLKQFSCRRGDGHLRPAGGGSWIVAWRTDAAVGPSAPPQVWFHCVRRNGPMRPIPTCWCSAGRSRHRPSATDGSVSRI